MKILLYSDYYKKRSGFGRIAKGMIKTWKALGHDVRQVGLGHNGFPLENDVVVYPTEIKDAPNSWGAQVLLYAIEDFKPDVVFTMQDNFVLKNIGFELAHPGTF